MQSQDDIQEAIKLHESGGIMICSLLFSVT